MRRSVSFAVVTAAAGLLAVNTACAQQGTAPRPSQATSFAPARLGPDQLAVYDCKAEVQLVGAYWDRMANKLRLDASVYRRATQAYQSGDIQACYAAVQDTRRYLGL